MHEWNKVWVNQPGRPVFDYRVNYSGNKISDLTLVQHPETGAKRIWPQSFQVTLVYADHNKVIPVNTNEEKVVLKEASGLAKPTFILFNADGMGYGLFPTDKNLINGLYNLKYPLQRASAYITSYENMLAYRYFKPNELLILLEKGLLLEKNEMNLRLITGYIN